MQLEKQKEFEKRNALFNEIKDERATWIEQRKIRELTIKRRIAEYEILSSEDISFATPGEYAQLLFALKDFTEGETYKRDEEYLLYLDAYYNQEKKSLAEFIGTEQSERYKRILAGNIDDLSIAIMKLETEIAKCQTALEEIEFEIKSNKQVTITTEDRDKVKAEYSHARTLLQRLESRVFEEEVWNAIKPLKEIYNVKTVDVQDDGKKKTINKILYKSDLLFYLKIYMQLYPRDIIPEIRLICIDEGQDVHPSEYSVLRSLYPNAKLNIFGDITQELHEECGISDWEKETGVRTVYSLNKNYRNEPEIVEFCNHRFGAKMEYVGETCKDAYPQEIKSISELKSILTKSLHDASKLQKLTIIVKDKETFSAICEKIGSSERNFEFIDTNASVPNPSKINCYSIYAAKGLEFPKVLVCSQNMTRGQKIVACTRATERLYYYE